MEESLEHIILEVPWCMIILVADAMVAIDTTRIGFNVNLELWKKS